MFAQSLQTPIIQLILQLILQLYFIRPIRGYENDKEFLNPQTLQEGFNF